LIECGELLPACNFIARPFRYAQNLTQGRLPDPALMNEAMDEVQEQWKRS
jgi:hypothetical protein